MAYFQNIVSLVDADNEIAICDMEIITAREKQRLLVSFNDTAAKYPDEKTIHQLFCEQAARTPDSIAVTGLCMKREGVSASNNRVSLSYRHLRTLALQVAPALIEKGVTGDTIAAVKTERTVEMIAALLGILEAGGAYLPIEPGLPEERSSYILSDSAARVLVTT
ncbi:MAG: AMP-binding protein, partial [bacterium]|nr:AMP-binding protein [bacterium]